MSSVVEYRDRGKASARELEKGGTILRRRSGRGIEKGGVILLTSNVRGNRKERKEEQFY